MPEVDLPEPVLYVAVHALVTGMSDSGSYLCGASASVLAVIAASAIRTPDARLYLFLIGEVKLKWVALGCIVLTFAGVGGGNAGGQAAHVGGVLFGVLFTLAINAGYDPVKRFADKMRDVSSREPISMPRRKNVRRDGNAVARAAGGSYPTCRVLTSFLTRYVFPAMPHSPTLSGVN